MANKVGRTNRLTSCSQPSKCACTLLLRIEQGKATDGQKNFPLSCSVWPTLRGNLVPPFAAFLEEGACIQTSFIRSPYVRGIMMIWSCNMWVHFLLSSSRLKYIPRTLVHSGCYEELQDDFWVQPVVIFIWSFFSFHRYGTYYKMYVKMYDAKYTMFHNWCPTYEKINNF